MQVLRAPNRILRTSTKPVKRVTPELLKLAKEMIKTTKGFKDPEGVGLSANQIGEEERIFVAKLNGERFEIFINPQIISTSKKTKIFFEGCLSVPDFWGETERPIAITALYQDKTGQTIKKRLTGTAAWIFQHEVDHLDGKLFVDRVLEQKRRMFKVVGKDPTGADIFEEVNLV